MLTAPKPLTKALEDAMYAKATAPWSRMFLQTLTGGAFIALGFVVMVTTQAKLGHDWHQAFFLGILANLAVCLAVWVATVGKTVTDKVLGVTGPIALFVATGFEHSVANMFMLPMGLLIKAFAGPSPPAPRSGTT